MGACGLVDRALGSRSGVRFPLQVTCRSVGQTSHSILALTTQQWWVPGGMRKLHAMIGQNCSRMRNAKFSSEEMRLWKSDCTYVHIGTQYSTKSANLYLLKRTKHARKCRFLFVFMNKNLISIYNCQTQHITYIFAILFSLSFQT